MGAFSLSFYKDLRDNLCIIIDNVPMYYHNFVCIVFEYFNLPALDSYKKFSFQYTKNF